MIIGIVGGGQLARMMALAAYPLGLRCVILDPAPDACAGQVAELVTGAYDDRDELARLAARVDVATFDFENVPVEAARFLAERTPVFPPPAALEAAQDRLAEKTLFNRLGIPTPPFAAIDHLDELQAAAGRIGFPAVLKTRRLGYDGKGQRLLRAKADLPPAWEALGATPLILEGFVLFQYEVSILALRDRQGGTAFYPLVRNHHQEGVLRLSLAPWVAPELAITARDYAQRVLEALDYVGLLAIEFFVRDGVLLANEMAPRVHNSGHWTLEGAETSQFENHLRAIVGWPLGSTAARGHSGMVNFLGELPPPAQVLALPGAHYHAYGKAPQPGRKLGHATLRADTAATLRERLAALVPTAWLDV